MGVTTTIRATSDIDHRLLFLKARQVVGIPDEWPFHDEYDGASHHVLSEPGGFDARVTVWSHEFEAMPEDDEDEGPRPCFVDLNIDTSPVPRDYMAKHAKWAADIGIWLAEQGVTYAISALDGSWRTP